MLRGGERGDTQPWLDRINARARRRERIRETCWENREKRRDGKERLTLRMLDLSMRSQGSWRLALVIEMQASYTAKYRRTAGTLRWHFSLVLSDIS